MLAVIRTRHQLKVLKRGPYDLDGDRRSNLTNLVILLLIHLCDVKSDGTFSVQSMASTYSVVNELASLNEAHVYDLCCIVVKLVSNIF